MSPTKTARAKPSHNGTHRPIDRVLGGIRRLGLKFAESGPCRWRSQCPCHKGRSLNLSIKEVDDGTVVLHCHHQENGRETCSAVAIAAALGLKLKDLFPGANAGSVSKPPRKPSGPASPPVKCHRTAEAAIAGVTRQLGKPSECWVYNDWDGREVMRVYRFDEADGKKQFRPVHRDAAGWRLGDPPGKLPLYHLDRLGTDEPVYVLEGEKCVDLVVNLGAIATTSAHGAQSPAKTDWSPLAGRRVVIIPDNDGPGEGYAAKVAEILAGLEPRSDVRILRLPVRPDEDVEQWLDGLPEGWAPDQCGRDLARLAVGAPAWMPPPPTPPQPGDDGDGSSDGELAGKPRTDYGNAERLVARHGRNLRYCHPWSKWLRYDGWRWTIDDVGAVHRMAKDAARKILREAGTIDDRDERKAHAVWAFSSESRARVESMLAMATSEAGIPILPDDMDRDPWLFNCLNGTLDLRTGALRGHRREDDITKLCPVEFDPSARCSLWEQTLHLFFAGDAELIGYFQRLCGYALAGVIRDHIMPIAFGSGSNGKSTILGTLLETFGPDYAMKCPPDMLMVRRGDAHPTDRTDLFRKRLVVAIETEMGRRLNETMVKELTGGDRIRARRMREDNWEFAPTHTIIMATNHRPVIRGTDRGIWRRLKLIPFTVSVEGDRDDAKMPEKLRSERPGILAWCVRGCLAWQADGLKEPQAVREATEGYRREQDVLAGFLDEHTVQGPNYRVQCGGLYARYKQEAEKGNEFIMSLTAFGEAMRERGFATQKSSVKWYLGLALRDVQPD